MRHKVAGYKLGRTTSHRRSLLRNMVTSLIMEERIETTVPKAKALRPTVEKMITLGKRGDLAARRQAAAYVMTDEALRKLFDTIGPRFGDRNGGYTRIVRTTWQKGDGADKAFIELLGSEKLLDEKREKRAEARAKKAEETRKAMEEAEAQQQAQAGITEPETEPKEEKEKGSPKNLSNHGGRTFLSDLFFFSYGPLSNLSRRRARTGRARLPVVPMR